MAKKTTRKTAKSSPAPAGEPKSVTSATSTDKNGGSAKPKVKKIAPFKKEVKPEPAPKQRAMTVELLEGASYTIKGATFLKDRPVVVTDEKLLSELEVNSRFTVESA